MGTTEERAGYRRSAGSPRGQARRQELLERVTDDVAANGLVPALLSLCPEHWSMRRRREVAEMVLATPRGFLIDLNTKDGDGVDAGPAALLRALEREEAAGEPVDTV